jgi:Mn-dependent DtxR family transcriptional regulator
LLESTDFGKSFSRKLDFSWDEVHDIAEQLHIKSEKLINKLDDFLGNPTEDPMEIQSQMPKDRF